jgi:hypothetical protein
MAKWNTIHHADGSYTIDAGGVMFGPYGPGKCESVHPGSGMRCVHGRNHRGCHCAFDPKVPASVEKFKYRWH